MHNSITTPLGVMEGFFGRGWSWTARADYAGFLARQGYEFYIYAPKNDRCLRRQWQGDWAAPDFAQLFQLRSVYRQAGVAFGLGLSPFEIYREPGPESRAALKCKVESLNKLEPDILCLLFDDMRGDLPELARQQTELSRLAADATTASRVILCPTYYSFDPVLEKAFGLRPKHYWYDLGHNLDPNIDIFWTGPQVCSDHYPLEHLSHVTELLGRRPFLWDNYPVNDSARLSQYLRLGAFGSDRSQLNGHLAGHAVNPMNQAYLSQIPLSTLPRAYREGAHYDPDSAFVDACRTVCEPELAERLIEDTELFQSRGLNSLTPDQQTQLRARYQTLAKTSPRAQELLAWLAGKYAFDPACLTE